MSQEALAQVTTRFLLVRHGESWATVRQVVGGPLGCTGLSPLGQEQAARLRARFEQGFEPPVDVIVTSTMPRARETAEIVAGAYPDVQIEHDPNLVEHLPGEADGLFWRDVPSRFGPYRGDRLPHARMAPGAESLAEFHQRVGAAFHALTEQHLGRTAIVTCHGGVIDMVLRSILGLPYRTHHDLWTLNCSITEVSARHPEGEHPDRWRLVRYNDAAHLAGLAADTPADS